MKRTGVIVGLGSIGRRHLKNFRQACPDDEIVVLRRRDDNGEAVALGADRVVTCLEQAIEAAPQWSVIASPATEHAAAAVGLAAAGAHLLVEKPLASDANSAARIVKACRDQDRVLLTGYNLRFDACLQRMKQELTAETIGRVYGIHATVGQYLPDWRPTADYRQGVSARRELGGGALRELSHELDYVAWLAGDELSVISAVVDRVSDLEIDVEDWADLVLQGTDSRAGQRPVRAFVHLDFLSRVAHRSCRVTGSHGSLVWDAIARRLVLQGNAKSDVLVDQQAADRNESYEEMTKYFLGRIGRGEGFLSGDEQGAITVGLIEQAEKYRLR